MNIIIEALKAIFIVLREFLKLIPTFLELIDIPTSKYGLMEFLIQHNVVLFNSISLTKIILFIVPLVVGALSNFIIKKLRIRDRESKENINILLYLGILYIVSLWQFWLAVGIIAFIALVIVIICLVNNKKDIRKKN